MNSKLSPVRGVSASSMWERLDSNTESVAVCVLPLAMKVTLFPSDASSGLTIEALGICVRRAAVEPQPSVEKPWNAMGGRSSGSRLNSWPSLGVLWPTTFIRGEKCVV
ncbi:uncharacterized protein LOC112340510 [Selaginella moellendorffii]|uniref:uncharacterized protein LOC112340510 n=1 Tax=Selaginella moellendorffii TaxID=88036 RepID=UPI000D1D001A|nr:uncharacterized protein LOC112340510 [Selaginella moellendorffii]|eukprot:XP_024514802.1 uncharacterized protein LOC112340510 [Selaginella moellendorffii]